MKTNIAFMLLVMVALFTGSCKKSEEAPSDTNSSFSLSLATNKTSIPLGDQARITPSVSGATGNVVYKWSVNSSSLLTNYGDYVYLIASCPSCTGPNEVTCTAADEGSHLVSEKITISVR